MQIRANHFRCAAIMLAIIGGVAHADPGSPHDDRETSATSTLQSAALFESSSSYKTLLNSDCYTYDTVSFGGGAPPEVDALNELLDRQDADAAMKALFSWRNSYATRLYGLTGMFFTDSAAFNEGVLELKNSNNLVQHRDGCSLDTVPIRELVWSGKRNVLVIGSPARAVEELKVPKKAPYCVDIAHGGIPAILRSSKGHRGRSLPTPRPTPAPAVDFELESGK